MSVTSNARLSLPTDLQILITREFDAPRKLVYRAWTDPELVKRWWAGRRGEVTEIVSDLRVGGRWRNVLVTNGGFEVAFHGEFREIVPEERIVQTEVFEGMPDAEAVETITFSESGGRTTVSMLIEHSSKEHRDGHVASGMQDGLNEALDQLETVAKSLS